MKDKTPGDKLRWLREERCLKQGQVAKGLGISVPALSKIERNLTDMNMARIGQFADYYQINLASLLIENEPSAVFGNERIAELEQELKEQQQKIMELQGKLLALFEQ